MKMLICILFALGIFFLCNSIALANDEICYSKEEIFADLLTGYLAVQGQQAINCDKLLSTNSYHALVGDIIKSHRDKIRPYGEIFRKFCSRNNMDQMTCIQKRMRDSFDQLKGQKISKEECRAFYSELIERNKSWKTLVNETLVIYSLTKDNYNQCQSD